MKSIKFKECNTQYAKDQDQYNTLPALKIKGEEGHVVTCWKLSFLEKIKLLFGAKVWVSTMTFNKPLQPMLLSTSRKDHYSVNKCDHVWEVQDDSLIFNLFRTKKCIKCGKIK